MTYHVVQVPNSSNVSNAAVDVRNALSELSGVVTDAKTEWAKLPASYETPDQATVFAALDELPGIAEALSGLLGAAATALDTYASELQTLETRRTQVVQDMYEMEAEEPGSSWNMVNLFNQQVREADVECARALNSLRLDDPGVDASSTSYTAWSTTIGLTQGTLQWHKGALLTFRDAAKIPPTLTNPVNEFDRWPQTQHHGATYGRSPSSGLWLPSSAAPAPEAPDIKTSNLRAIPTPPPWARAGGKVLGFAGGGLTLYSAYGNEYNESLIRNPQYTQSEHQAEAGKRAAVTGGFEVAGAAGGAMVGASWGATIGTAVPVVGTVVGGIVGGLVGGLIGGFVGSKSGEVAEDVIFD